MIIKKWNAFISCWIHLQLKKCKPLWGWHHPKHCRYKSFVLFKKPDGNQWLSQGPQNKEMKQGFYFGWSQAYLGERWDPFLCLVTGKDLQWTLQGVWGTWSNCQDTDGAAQKLLRELWLMWTWGKRVWMWLRGKMSCWHSILLGVWMKAKERSRKGVKNRAFGFLAKWNLIYVK